MRLTSTTEDHLGPMVDRYGVGVAEVATECQRCIEQKQEIKDLRWESGYWRNQHRRALEREKRLKEEIQQIKAKLRLRERQLFERKSERQQKDFGSKVVDCSEPSKRKRGQQPGTSGHGRCRHEQLPVEEEVIDLPESDKVCPHCRKPFEAFPGTDDSDVVEIEVRAHRRVIRRKRYRRTCHCRELPRIVTAPTPPKLIPKGAFGVSFWVHVLIDKFLFQRPTFRLLTDLRLTHGLDVSPGTVTGGLKRLLPLFEPLYDGIRTKNIGETRWHADETRWLVFVEEEGKVGYTWWLWLFHSPSAVIYKLDPSHASSVPQAHFGEEAHGIVNVDRHRSYKGFLKEGRIQLAFCWAHVRRDFLTIANDWKKQRAWAFEWLRKIAELYRLNQERLSADAPEAFAQAQKRLATAVEHMAQDWQTQRVDPNLHPACRKPLESLKEHWPGLVLFVEHPEVPLDNNQAERDLRNPVVGRKNYYGSGSRWSGQLAAMLFSVFQTLLLWGLNPRQWLTDYLQACAEHGGNVPPKAREFLPWNMTLKLRRGYQIPRRQPPFKDTS